MQIERWLPAAVLAVVGTLQLWDCGVHRGRPAVIALGILGLAVPVLALAWAERFVVLGAALFASAALLLFARLLSPVPLNPLHLVTFAAAVSMLLKKRLASRTPVHPC